MKSSNLSKFVKAGVLSLSLVVLPSSLPAFAQTDTAPNTTVDGMQTQATDATTGDRDFDWGWLGLIGLAGLAGLAGKRKEPTRYQDPGTVGTPGYRE